MEWHFSSKTRAPMRSPHSPQHREESVSDGLPAPQIHPQLLADLRCYNSVIGPAPVFLAGVPCPWLVTVLGSAAPEREIDSSRGRGKTASGVQSSMGLSSNPCALRTVAMATGLSDLVRPKILPKASRSSNVSEIRHPCGKARITS